MLSQGGWFYSHKFIQKSLINKLFILYFKYPVVHLYIILPLRPGNQVNILIHQGSSSLTHVTHQLFVYRILNPTTTTSGGQKPEWENCNNSGCSGGYEYSVAVTLAAFGIKIQNYRRVYKTLWSRRRRWSFVAYHLRQRPRLLWASPSPRVFSQSVAVVLLDGVFFGEERNFWVNFTGGGNN